MNEPALEVGSFRDRTAQVFYDRGRVCRGLTDHALRQWEALSSTSFYERSVADGAIVASRRVDPSAMSLPENNGRWVAVLQHETIPFVSYPYEWPFGMLKDAALLHLDLLLAALDEGMTLKDASPYNVQWRGARPVFVDVASFETWRPGEPWIGYRQFCRTFLYPLLLLAYRGVPFHPWLRGSLDGIDAEACRRLMRPRDYLRAGVLLHVYLQARAQAAYNGTQRDVRTDLRTAGFNRDLIKANATRLRHLVAGLTWKTRQSGWSDYTNSAHYEPADAVRKREFVRDVMSARHFALVWDLGCNTGVFSRIAANQAECVVALDADHLAVELLYRQLKTEGSRNIVPLVLDLTDPSPGLGWRNLERRTLFDRGRPDLVLCLALIHHLVIGGNVPLNELLDWLAGLGGDLVIEFVTREDPMVALLLRNKDDQYVDYDLTHFEAGLASRFLVERREPLGSGTRVLYHARSTNRV